MFAYLVIREGAKWTDVFRLEPGRTVTIGRASTNEIVVKDERCSRGHAEVFFTNGEWTLRDLDSRNGTFVGDSQVRSDHVLTSGEVVRIAHFQLAFVHDLSEAFNDAGNGRPAAFNPPPSREPGDETVIGRAVEICESAVEPTSITHRRRETRFLDLSDDDETDQVVDRLDRAATKLCKLAFEMANLQDEPALAHLALNGLFEGTQVDSGGVLLPKSGIETPETIDDFAVVASRSDLLPSYYRLSEFVANTVLRGGEAVLARNVSDDSTLASRDSQGMIHSTGVICAPIRSGSQIIGLVHIYSTDLARTPDANDLEFTLYVADNMAMALMRLGQQKAMAAEVSQSRDEIVELRKRLGAESELVGASSVLARVQQQVMQAAPSRATVLIRGESGVGKELVARAVHFASPRRKGPFVCLNCAALSETLLESELFGHERGAFTGATDRKMGKFESANKGTLMLDEIGEMSSAVQAKFLRVLEGHPFERVGGNKAIDADVRVIAATNRDLEKAVEANKFRRDLYFRLRVVEIAIPPLRKRGNDVIELANHFLVRFREETGRRLVGFSAGAMDQLRRYRWPGNVRELKNVIERAVVLAQGDVIDVEDLSLSNLATSGDTGEIVLASSAYSPSSLADVEKAHIAATLESTDWNKSRAAAILGIERSTLDRKIRRYELQTQGAKPPRRR
jgi:Nif-specific regulatory protein